MLRLCHSSFDRFSTGRLCLHTASAPGSLLPAFPLPEIAHCTHSTTKEKLQEQTQPLFHPTALE